MWYATPDSYVHRATFHTRGQGQSGNPVEPPFKPSAIRLIKPPPHDANHLIRAGDPLPSEVYFEGGRMIVHGFGNDRIKLDFYPPEYSFDVEIDVLKVPDS
jgi:hypothetical protein